MNLYIAEEGQPLCIWDQEATVTYRGNTLFFQYEGEPPHGDFLYSVQQLAIHKTFPYWVYGRKLIFLDACYLLAETVEPGKWSPVKSVFFNICTGQYAVLDKWYPEIMVKKQALTLSNPYDHSVFPVLDFGLLPWKFM